MVKYIFMLHVLLLPFLCSVFAKTDNECSETTIHTSDYACETNSVTYGKLTAGNSLCNNLYLLGFVSQIQKYVFLTNHSTIILYGHENDISEKKIPFKSFNMTGAKIIKAMIKEGVIFLKTEKLRVYYTLVLTNLNGAISFSFYPWGKIAHTIYMQNCKNFFVFKALNNTVVQKEMKYKINKFVFVKNYTKSYTENIDALIQTNPSKINVITISGKIFEQFVVDFDEVTTTTTITESNIISSFSKMEVIIPIILLIILLIGACVYIIFAKINQAKRRKSAKNTPEQIPLREMRVLNTQNDNDIGIPARIVFNSDPSLINSNGHPSLMTTRTMEAKIYLTQSNNEQPSDTLGNVDVRYSSLPYANLSSATRMAMNNLQDKLVIASKISIVPESFKTEQLDWDRKVLLSSGAFGNVYKCVYTDGDKCYHVAVKQPKRSTNESFKEERLMTQLKNHPHILKLITTRLDDNMLLIMPLLECNLSEYLHDQQNLTLTHKIRYCQQIANGMSYLMFRQILHCNLKASNILVVDENLVQISGFGKAERLEDIGRSRRPVTGTITHTAMELLDPFPRMLNCEATDVWSFGVTIWEIFNVEKQTPYADCVNPITEVTILSYLHGKNYLKTTYWPPKENNESLLKIESYMKRCLVHTQGSRPTFDKLWYSFSILLPEGLNFLKKEESMGSSSLLS